MNATMAHSPLYRDLAEGGRDALYRAMSFIGHQGGPRLQGIAGDPTDLALQRQAMLAWLAERPDDLALMTGYERFCERWSPIFID
jgi:hypothetical protein